MPREGGQVECLTCHRLSTADETVFRQLRRLEGASDPDDMLAVVGLACPHCSAQGTAVLGYGPEAEAVDTEVLERLAGARRPQTRGGAPGPPPPPTSSAAAPTAPPGAHRPPPR